MFAFSFLVYHTQNRTDCHRQHVDFEETTKECAFLLHSTIVDENSTFVENGNSAKLNPVLRGI
jgi:hypothetical protein